MILPDSSLRVLVTVFLLLVLSFLFMRVLRTYRVFYSKFPNIFFVPVLLRCIVLGEKPKNTPATSFYFQKMLNLIKERQRDGFCLLWLHEPFLVVNNAEAIKFFNNEPSAAYKPPIYGLFRELMGLSLLSSNGTLWKKHRKMLNPVFKSGIIKDKISTINKNSKLLVESLSKQPQGTSIDILEYVRLSAFLNISEFLSGMDYSGRQEEIKKCMQYIDKATELMNYRFFQPWLLPKFTLHFFSKGREFLRENEGPKLGEKMLQELIETSKAKMSEVTDAAQGEHGRTFGELVVEYLSNDPSFTMQDVKNHYYNLLVGGFDTIAYTMMWCLFLLGHHPEIQDQVYNELQGVMVKDTLSYDDLPSLKYMDCVLKETIRLYPVAPIFARHLQQALKFGNYTIPKGTNLVFIPFSCQRDPEFFPNPDNFEPERFLEGDPDNYKWPLIPFAEGVRNCIGKRFAFVEMKVLLAHILQKFKLTSVENFEDVQMTWEIFLKAVEPVHVRLTPRQ